MGGWIRGVNEKVIHLNDEPFFCDHVMKEVIHEALEGGGGISETKEHHG